MLPARQLPASTRSLLEAAFTRMRSASILRATLQQRKLWSNFVRTTELQSRPSQYRSWRPEWRTAAIEFCPDITDARQLTLQFYPVPTTASTIRAHNKYMTSNTNIHQVGAAGVQAQPGRQQLHSSIDEGKLSLT